MKNIVLTDERVLLKPLEQYNWEDLLEYAVNETDIWKYAHTPLVGEQGIKDYIQYALEERDKGTSLPFIVFDLAKEKYVGSTRFYGINHKQKSLLIGYTWYSKQTQGSGINVHCKYLLLKYAFEFMEMERVEFRADARNERSIGAMKRLGAVQEGVLRKEIIINDGSRRDTVVLSILREEWFNHVKNNLEERL